MKKRAKTTTISEKQLAANRKNALKGGVKTSKGKAITRYNAMKHGLLCKEVLIEGEDNKTLSELEKTAKKDEMGLWSNKNPIPPWDYRKGKSAKISKKQQILPATGEDSVIVYRTKTGKKYHRGNCTALRKSKIPITLKEVKNKGLTPCKNVICRNKL